MTAQSERTHGLGRGLAALIPQRPAGQPTTEISVDRIAPNPFQPRRRFDDAELASRLLVQGNRDTSSNAREADESLRIFGYLLRQGFDVVGALRKDRTVDLDTLYYVGFHFIEEDNPAGEELLQIVVDKGGRKKIGKMAKNKLALAGRAA